MTKETTQLAASAKQTFLEFLNEKKIMITTQIKTALPKHIDPDKMIRVLITEIRKNKELGSCTTPSILSAFIQTCQLGLEPGSILGQAYLIPYRNNKTNTYECQFMIGYRGMISLARRSGEIRSIMAQAVYANDFFEYEYGSESKIKHIPANGERGAFTHAYMVAKLANTYTPNGEPEIYFEVMSKTDIDKIRARSKAANSSYSPWATDYEEMAKKTIIRRGFKYLPISTEVLKNVQQEEAIERGDDGSDFLDDLIEDGEIITPDLKPQSKSDRLADKLAEKQPEPAPAPKDSMAEVFERNSK